MLTRSFLIPGKSPTLLSYTPMFHSRLFVETAKYRDQCFQPTRKLQQSSPTEPGQANAQSSSFYLDGNPSLDRPLFVQFCANNPDDLLTAAKHVEPFCDAVDLNLGCPQGIARKGRYGAFLQEDWNLIYKLINRLHTELAVAVTAKIRILETKQRTLEYARMVIAAGASILTVHGRQRHQKGHETGLADWSVIRYLRDNLPTDVVLFANGNILQHEDIEKCLHVTGADGMMSAEGNLYDPTIFAEPPPTGEEGREYWRGRDGKGGYRMDAVMRRYMDIIYRYVLEQDPPRRKPLFCLSDSVVEHVNGIQDIDDKVLEQQPPSQKRDKKGPSSPNLQAMQPHLFHLLRPLLSKHTHIRDVLAKARTGDMATYERILRMVETVTKEGLIEYAKNTAEEEEAEGEENSSVVVPPPSHNGPTSERGVEHTTSNQTETATMDDDESSAGAIQRCYRPWWVCQPYVRPLPLEAIAKGALAPPGASKKKQPPPTSLLKGMLPEAEAPSRLSSVDDNEQARIKVSKEALVCG